jgi:hypothetical protein
MQSNGRRFPVIALPISRTCFCLFCASLHRSDFKVWSGGRRLCVSKPRNLLSDKSVKRDEYKSFYPTTRQYHFPCSHYLLIAFEARPKADYLKTVPSRMNCSTYLAAACCSSEEDRRATGTRARVGRWYLLYSPPPRKNIMIRSFSSAVTVASASSLLSTIVIAPLNCLTNSARRYVSISLGILSINTRCMEARGLTVVRVWGKARVLQSTIPAKNNFIGLSFLSTLDHVLAL